MHKPERKSLKMIGNSDADRETGEQRCRQRDGGSDADRETVTLREGQASYDVARVEYKKWNK